MTVSESQIVTLNPGSARFGEPGELVVQRMRFKLHDEAAGEPSYNAGGFDVTLDEMVVVEAASVTREGDLLHPFGDVSANNYLPVIKEIQVDGSGNKVTIQLIRPDTGVELATGTDISGNKYVLEAEGH